MHPAIDGTHAHTVDPEAVDSDDSDEHNTTTGQSVSPIMARTVHSDPSRPGFTPVSDEITAHSDPANLQKHYSATHAGNSVVFDVSVGQQHQHLTLAQSLHDNLLFNPLLLLLAWMKSRLVLV